MKNKVASFSQRLVAYIIDVSIITLIASILSFPFIDNKSIDKLNKTNESIATDFINNKIDAETYISESSSIIYEISKKGGLILFITIFLQMIYFIVFQLYNKGQTFGKKLLKIKVISSENSELTYNQIILRSFLINFIMLNFIKFALIIFSSKTNYFYLVSFFEFIQYLFVFVSIVMILFSKKKCGLHDLVSHTKVVCVE